MDKANYYQVIEDSEIYHTRYVHRLEKENKALKQLLEWTDECGFTFDQIWNDDFLDEDKFIEDTKGMDYIDTMIYYAERWIEEYESDWRS